MIYKLLFVIILASNVFAQHTEPNLIERDSTGKLTAAPVKADTSLYWITFVGWIEPPYSEAIYELLELYKEYETECWNDSTFEWRPVPDYSWLSDQKIWIHKIPTFSDFIEHLRKKQ